MIEFSTAWPLLAIGTAVAGFFGQIKAFFNQLRSLIIVRVELDHSTGDALTMLLWKEAGRWRIGDRRYMMEALFVRALRKPHWIVFELPGSQGIVFLVNRRIPLLVCNKHSGEQTPDVGRTFFASYFRGTLNLDSLLQRAADHYNAIRQPHGRRFQIIKLIGTVGRRNMRANESAGEDDLIGRKPLSHVSAARPVAYGWPELGTNGDGGNELARLALSPECESALRDIRRWSRSEAWYQRKGIQWRYGLGLHGPPGTGKTSLARAVAKELDFPLYVFDLATMDNMDLTRAWNRMLSNAPCVALIEDIDTVFRGRAPATRKIELTFECLLNCLSGIETANGVLTIITTNAVEHIDPALGAPEAHGRSSRPGRIDTMVKMDVLSLAGRQKIAAGILSDAPDLIQSTVADGCDETGAQFENRCRDIALQQFWQRKE